MKSKDFHEAGYICTQKAISVSKTHCVPRPCFQMLTHMCITLESHQRHILCQAAWVCFSIVLTKYPVQCNSRVKQFSFSSQVKTRIWKWPEFEAAHAITCTIRKQKMMSVHAQLGFSITQLKTKSQNCYSLTVVAWSISSRWVQIKS